MTGSDSSSRTTCTTLILPTLEITRLSPALKGFEVVVPVVVTLQSVLVSEAFTAHLALVLLVLGVSMDSVGVPHQVSLIVEQFATDRTGLK